MTNKDQLKSEIMQKITQYYLDQHADQEFIPGVSRVKYAGRVFDDIEMQMMVSAVLDFWLTAGPYAMQFEKELGKFLGVHEIIPVNSGSSANLVAVTALRSKQLGERRLRVGDEVIVPATSFPTTIAPLIQNGLIPVFVDCNLADYNLDINEVKKAISPRTKAIMFAHTLGNPADMDNIVPIVQENDFLLIEDVCDALGSTYDGRMLGTFGDVATLSFYPAHHITLGEGGAVFTKSRRLAKIARSVRDWGRDCWCEYDNPPNGKCGRRFETEIPGISGCYDHRYYFTEIGYNLKLTDPQAAIGLAQLAKLPDFIDARKKNFKMLYDGLKEWQDYFILPTWHSKSDPSWFAFPITVRSEAPFNRNIIIKYLEEHNIETRMLFAGNVLRQPGYVDVNCRIIGDLSASDYVMNSTFFIGVYPGINDDQIDYILDIFNSFVRDIVC
ncbi:MAG TPA: lipopolysaccharide biosynthesis protein RfbH [Chloroflexi bacterium]|nr:lipopolysaccharide biosynthesis protein RfbH [Chloroflexota bacterium]